MHVSGDLFRLPSDSKLVPLPWFCRAPLGLKTGTSVHVVLVESSLGEGEQGSDAPRPTAGDAARHPTELLRPPDLLVSVLDPNAWDSTYLIEASALDGPGLLHRLLAAIATANAPDKHINVVVGESFTVPSRGCADQRLRNHQTTLYCQLQRGTTSKRHLDEVVKQLNAAAPAKHKPVKCAVAPRPAGTVVKYLGQEEVRDGLVRLDVDWRWQARTLFEQGLADVHGSGIGRSLADQFDFSLASALADLHARAIRLTFPLKGARRLITLHTDEPNTAVKVTEQLEPGHSILGGLLAKADAGSAELVAVCEPMPGQSELPRRPFDGLQMAKEFRRLASKDPLGCEDVVYPKLPDRELFRQFGKMVQPYGKDALELVADLAAGTVRDRSPAGSPGRLTCCACVPVIGARHRAALDWLGDSASVWRLNPRGELDVHVTASPIVRLVRLLTADVAYFVVWASADPSMAAVEAQALVHAMLYAQLAKGRGLLLVEAENGELPHHIRAMEPALQRRVDIRSFSWRQDHADAADQLRLDHSQPLPPVLSEPGCFGNRVADWMYERELVTR